MNNLDKWAELHGELSFNNKDDNDNEETNEE